VWLRDHPHERIAMGARARRDVARRFDIMAHLGALAHEIDGLGSRA
jgi:hypothetical protein